MNVCPVLAYSKALQAFYPMPSTLIFCLKLVFSPAPVAFSWAPTGEEAWTEGEEYMGF